MTNNGLISGDVRQWFSQAFLGYWIGRGACSEVLVYRMVISNSFINMSDP